MDSSRLLNEALQAQYLLSQMTATQGNVLGFQALPQLPLKTNDINLGYMNTAAVQSQPLTQLFNLGKSTLQNTDVIIPNPQTTQFPVDLTKPITNQVSAKDITQSIANITKEVKKAPSDKGSVGTSGEDGLNDPTAAEEKMRRRRCQIALASRKSRAKRKLEFTRLKEENKRLKMENESLKATNSNTDCEVLTPVSILNKAQTMLSSFAADLETLSQNCTENDNITKQQAEKVSSLLQQALLGLKTV